MFGKTAYVQSQILYKLTFLFYTDNKCASVTNSRSGYAARPRPRGRFSENITFVLRKSPLLPINVRFLQNGAIITKDHNL